MKSDKELFELFRKNQYRLNERPSPNGWKRLERKLDNHRMRHRIAFRRTMSMVASLALLVAVLFLLTLPSQNTAISQRATPQFWEDLPSNSDNNEIKHLVELSHEYQRQMGQAIEETPTKQKIIPNVNYLSD